MLLLISKCGAQDPQTVMNEYSLARHEPQSLLYHSEVKRQLLKHAFALEQHRNDVERLQQYVKRKRLICISAKSGTAEDAGAVRRNDTRAVER